MINSLFSSLRSFFLLLILALSCFASAAEYTGRVVDEAGEAVPYATVYLQDNPIEGTATNMDGYFVLHSEADPKSVVIISYIGYQKKGYHLAAFAGEGRVVQLVEQPIALQEMVVSAKPAKQKNKKKAMKQLLYKVYNRMQYDFSDTPSRYRIVSDVQMKSEQTPWGMEQMIATVVNLPGKGREGRDSVQFCGEYCKRFFQQSIRNRADDILAGDKLSKDVRKMANEMDSGVVVHEGLWAIGNVRYDLEKTMDDLRHWSVSNESETETVLTHVEKKNYLGIFKYEYKRHYIVDSETYRILRFSEELTMVVNIPFGYKVKGNDLELLNLLNMNEDKIEKFRLKKADARITLNTIYAHTSRHTPSGRDILTVYPIEKNLSAKATLVGTKDMQIPLDIKATQRVTSVKTDAAPMRKSEMKKRIEREIVGL